MDSSPRYTSRPLPAYRHLPGITPHPTRDPSGHSFGTGDEADLPNLNRTDWRTCEHYLYGIDLFNAYYWWECHEAFEHLWLTSGRRSPAGHALQAVIQCAAAHLKMADRRPLTAGRLYAHALVHVSRVETPVLGLDLDAMLRDTRAFLSRQVQTPARLVLDFRDLPPK